MGKTPEMSGNDSKGFFSRLLDSLGDNFDKTKLNDSLTNTAADIPSIYAMIQDKYGENAQSMEEFGNMNKGNAVSLALQGAKTGGQLGSLFGPGGTVAGGVLGGVAGSITGALKGQTEVEKYMEASENKFNNEQLDESKELDENYINNTNLSRLKNEIELKKNQQGLYNI